METRIYTQTVKGALCAEVIQTRISNHQNDETLRQNSLRDLSKVNLPIAVLGSCRAPLTRIISICLFIYLGLLGGGLPPRRVTVRINPDIHPSIYLTVYEQALVCPSNGEILDVSRGRPCHCKMADNRGFLKFCISPFSRLQL